MCYYNKYDKYKELLPTNHIVPQWILMTMDFYDLAIKVQITLNRLNCYIYIVTYWYKQMIYFVWSVHLVRTSILIGARWNKPDTLDSQLQVRKCMKPNRDISLRKNNSHDLHRVITHSLVCSCYNTISLIYDGRY